MANLINDGSLVGFWPLLEPSGAPLFKNYSPAYAKYPSGISFDMHVSTAAVTTKEENNSFWPGTTSFVEPASGVLMRGYSVGGQWKSGTDSSPHSKYLVLGGGGRPQAEQCLSVPVAQSGFTVGIWAYPNGNGYLAANQSASNLSAGNKWRVAYARAHTLIGQFSAFIDNGGWMMGVSGNVERGAQFNFQPESGDTLNAYVSMTKANNTLADLFLETPIEAGRYTHLTMSYRYLGGSSNEVVLYKDGRVAASGTTNDTLTLSNTNIISNTQTRALTIGGSDPEATTSFANHYDATSGWNNLVSGVYLFRRVLHEGEVLELHERGGLVAEEAVLPPTAEVELTDVDLVGYYPHLEPGFADVSMNHRPLISNMDMGSQTLGALALTGPFGGACVYNDGNNDYIAHVANSGTCYDLLSKGSWTIGLYFGGSNSNFRDDLMGFSWGSVTSLTSATSEPASAPLTGNTAGICCTVSGISNQQRYVIEVYPDGDVTSLNTLVFNVDGAKEYYDTSMFHLALAYDDSTQGVAVYLNGVQQGSGTLSSSLTDQLMTVTGLGYPLMFGNGIQDVISDSITVGFGNRGVHTGGGQDTCIGPIVLAKRALLPNEIRAIATSGIDISRVYRTRHDPRLMGYWPASDFKIDDIVVEDQARCWQEFTGNLIRGDSFLKQDRWYDKDPIAAASENLFTNEGKARYNQFGFRTLPPELASYGNLGITSGTFSVKGGSIGTSNVSNSSQSRSAIANLSSRYKPVFGDRDLVPQTIVGEFVLSYEVTPSGDIPATLLGLRNVAAGSPTHNSLLHTYSNDGVNDTRSYLTTLEAGSGSGVSLVWLGEDNVPLVSGNIPYGVPTRVLMHGKFDLPNQMNTPFNGGGNAPYTVSLWIGGELVHRRNMTANTAAIWNNNTPDGSTDVQALSIGGIVGNSTNYVSQFTAVDSGLGETYMREIFLMRGVFDKYEIEALAVSGIQSPSIPGFTNNQQKTQVTIADSNLVAYYRFNGFDGGGSGTTDVSLNSNHLFAAQESLAAEGVNTQGAWLLRAFPGPFEASDIGVACSGFTYSSREPTNSAPHTMPPFMASGTRFNSPTSSFSVGFFYIKKDETAAGDFDTIVAYGIVPTTASTTGTNEDYGWAIGLDQSDNMKMVMSVNDGSPGNMYLTPVSNAAQAGQVFVGSFGDSTLSFGRDLSQWEQYHQGSQRNPRLDSWGHYCWVYDDTVKQLSAYVNGDLVDRKYLGSTKNPNVPTEFARYLTFFQHTSDWWTVGSNVTNDHEGSLTDFFYFDDALTPAEIRYIAQNGIDSAVGTPTSGLIGGYMRGQDTGSGLIGGLSYGQDTGSGLMGGFMPGGIEGSGLFGGYVSGVVFGDGTIGGWIRGLDDVSGIIGGYMRGVDVGSGSIAGYITGQDVGSGHFGGLIFSANVSSGIFGGLIRAADVGSGLIGGLMLGGLQGNFEFDAGFTVEVLAAEDFDAQVEIAKTTSSDFDAKVIIFQDELPPLVDILIPGSTVEGLAPPFNQYFIGAASGRQGKTITSTKWTFGDLTPSVTVSESGAGFYPTLHRYAASGFYIAKFEAIDSNGLHASATRIINAASGIDPVIVSLSGVPRSGNAELIVDFTTTVDILPPGVSIITQLLNYDDGQSTISFNPTHSYTQPGTYKPIWCVRDSRGVIWCDSLEAGNDYLEA